MATRFCTSCGAPIQPGKKFCARCGAPVADASPAPDATIAQATAPAGAPTSQAKQKLGTGTIVAIVAAALLALALVFLIAWSASGNALPWQARDGQAQGVAGEKSEAAKSKADRKKAAEAKRKAEEAKAKAEEKAKEEAERKADAAAQAQRDAEKSATDAQFKAQILPYYNRLSDYDSRIASCATTFNSIYLSGDYAARSSAAQECYALEQSIQSDATSFSSIQAPEGSSYATQHAAIMRCLNDLQSRIACISNAWTTDLVYEDPAPYK
ncbi:zinc ribbon domain-containing protein, partial [Parafannyhessea umbonata]|uniref:zinc ribbon domain-containing protein n=1 Tax=Parafannyhessea umbonata TaxID=604330 RepID=UPI0026F33B5C